MERRDGIELIAICPMTRLPPGKETLRRIAELHVELGRQLTPVEVLACLEPEGRA